MGSEMCIRDSFLTDDIRVISENKTLCRFPFASDHHPVVTTVVIRPPSLSRSPPRSEATKVTDIGKKWIPIHKRDEAASALARKLETLQWDEIQPSKVQESYNFLENSLKEILKIFGINKGEIRTDDKLSLKTKQLILVRTNLRSKVSLNLKEQIELVELRKTIKKKIGEDIRAFDESVARELIEST